MRLPAGGQGGFSLLEVIIASVLVVVIAANLTLVFRSAEDSHTTQRERLALDEQGRLTLDRIAYAIMGASRESLAPDAEAPIHSEALGYRVILGIEDGEVVYADPERIALSEAGGQVVWTRNPGLPGAQSVVWSNVVRPFLEGELPNGVDDNANGLIDEKGLSFALDRDSVTVRLDLERQLPDGKIVQQVLETIATCRN